MQDSNTKGANHAPQLPSRAAGISCKSPGPTNVPDRILRAMDYPTIDHRGPEFNALAKKVLRSVRQVFQTKQPVIVYPASGTGAWEAALGEHAVGRRPGADVGDRPLRLAVEEDGRQARHQVGVHGRRLAQAADPAAIEKRLKEDNGHAIKAVCIVHNETSTGVVSDISAVRQAIDAAKHPALLLVDTISSLGSIDYRHDAWGVDVTVAGSQKGLMLPPGLSFNAVSEKAVAASKNSQDAQGVLELGGDAGGQRQRLVPLHARHQPDLRPERGLRHAAGGRPRRGVRPPRPPRRGDAHRRHTPGASRSCAAIPRPIRAR